MDILIKKNFYNTIKIFPDTQILIDNFDEIKKELLNVLEVNDDYFYDYDKIIKYHKNTDWKIIPIFGFDKFSKISSKFPILINLLKQIQNVKMVFFSKLGKNTILNQHKGWNGYSNNVLRTQLGIIANEQSGLWVEGTKYYLKEGDLITFDDSKLHFAFNNTEQNERLVLIIDIVRPEFIEKGKSNNVLIDEELKHFLEII